jgi:hypothetical protein
MDACNVSLGGQERGGTRSAACRLAALGSCWSWGRVGRAWRRQLPDASPGGNGASLRAALPACGTAPLRVRSGQALERSIRGTVAARVKWPEWGGALQALLCLSLSFVYADRRCSASCPRTRTRGSRSDEGHGALSQLSESHSAVYRLLRASTDAARATLASLERARTSSPPASPRAGAACIWLGLLRALGAAASWVEDTERIHMTPDGMRCKLLQSSHACASGRKSVSVFRSRRVVASNVQHRACSEMGFVSTVTGASGSRAASLRHFSVLSDSPPAQRDGELHGRPVGVEADQLERTQSDGSHSEQAPDPAATTWSQRLRSRG